MAIKKGFWKNTEDTVGFAACDNPLCPLHPKNGGEPNKRHETYQNGKITLCEVCVNNTSDDTSETFFALEDTQGRCSICGAMKSKATHPSYWRYWKGNGNCRGKNHQWIKDD